MIHRIQFNHFLAIVTFSILLSSCRKETSAPEGKDNSIVSAKAWFDRNSKLYPEIWTTNQNNLDWENAITVSTSNSSNYLVVPYKNLVRFQIKAIALSRQLVFTIKKGGEIEKANVLETFAPENYLIKNKNELFKKYFSKDFNSFTGGFIFYNFDYSIIDKPNYRGGVKIGENEVKIKDKIISGKSVNSAIKSQISSKTAECNYYFFGIFYSDGSFLPLYYIGSVCEVEEGSQINWANFEGSNNGNPGGTGGPTLEQILDAFDNNIKDSLTTPCVKAILANLKSLQGGEIGKIINLLSQNIPSWNWVLYEGSTSNNNNAETWPLGPNGCATVLNPDRIQHYTELAIVRTMLHEAIHAYLVNFYYNDPGAVGLAYPELVQYYYQGIDTATAQHIAMGNNLVGSIAYALKYYGQGHGYDLPDELYNDMAWGGLYGENSGVPAFNALTPFVRERIRNRNAAENSSTIRDTEVPSGAQACNF